MIKRNIWSDYEKEGNYFDIEFEGSYPIEIQMLIRGPFKVDMIDVTKIVSDSFIEELAHKKAEEDAIGYFDEDAWRDTEPEGAA